MRDVSPPPLTAADADVVRLAAERGRSHEQLARAGLVTDLLETHRRRPTLVAMLERLPR